MYHNSHSEGTCVLLEIPSMYKLVQYFQTLHRNEDIYEFTKVYILPPLNLIFSQAMLKIVVYQMLIVTIVIFLDFHSTEQGQPLADSWSRGLD